MIFVIVVVFVRGVLVRLTLTLAVVLFNDAFLAAGDFGAMGFATITAAGFGRATTVEVAGFLVLAFALGVALAALGLVLEAGFLEVAIVVIDVVLN